MFERCFKAPSNAASASSNLAWELRTLPKFPRAVKKEEKKIIKNIFLFELSRKTEIIPFAINIDIIAERAQITS